MSELAPLIEDLAFILVLAGIVTIICKKFNQPLVLGYILAGFLPALTFTCCPMLQTEPISPSGLTSALFLFYSAWDLISILPESKVSAAQR